MDTVSPTSSAMANNSSQLFADCQPKGERVFTSAMISMPLYTLFILQVRGAEFEKIGPDSDHNTFASRGGIIIRVGKRRRHGFATQQSGYRGQRAISG